MGEIILKEDSVIQNKATAVDESHGRICMIPQCYCPGFSTYWPYIVLLSSSNRGHVENAGITCCYHGRCQLAMIEETDLFLKKTNLYQKSEIGKYIRYHTYRFARQTIGVDLPNNILIPVAVNKTWATI